MKIGNILFTLLLVIFTGSVSFAADYSSVTGLSPMQTEQLKRIEFAYKQQYETIEKRIQNYKEKINEVKNDTEKSTEQKSLLTGAYERNIEILKKQQKQAADVAENSYKSTLNEEQYQQFRENRAN